MNSYIYILILYILLVYFLNNFVLKNNFLRSYTGSNHQLFVNKSVPLTGGIFIILPVIYIFFSYDLFLILFLTAIFIIGLLSDLNFINSPKKRFFLQLFLIIFYIFFTRLEVLPTKIDFIDNNIEQTILSYALTIFCLMILINGSNFIDGLNGLFLGYVTIILFIILKNNLFYVLGTSIEEFFFIIGIFIFILILNYLNKLFVGDSGSYAIGFLIGFILIKIYNLSFNLSPYFIILLLWYPCFENLFCIIRKLNVKKSPLKPDNKHLHQFLFQFLLKKFNLQKIIANNLASMSINLFNIIIFYFASLDASHTFYQIKLIAICVVSYMVAYKILKTKVSY